MLIQKRTLPVIVRGTVVDIETTGLPEEGAEVITLGTVSGNQVTILQKTFERDFLKITLAQLAKMPRPFFAFNKAFEEAMLGIHIDGELQVEAYEKKSRAIAVAQLHDPYNGYGIEVIDAWNRFRESQNLQHLHEIMEHNESDLLLETCLLVVRHSKPMRVMVAI